MECESVSPGFRRKHPRLGSDTAGSLRIPAEICGVAGFRPSKGRYSVEGCVPLSRHDTPGPMAATVKDIALLDACLIGSTRNAVPPTAFALQLGALLAFSTR